MKELTIEEKAKCYDEALERARLINNGEGVEVEDGTSICEAIFPELKESEDERIRKPLIYHFRGDGCICANANEYRIDNKDIRAWLEKQGEQETLCDKCRREHLSHSCQDITELGRCVVEHEQNPTDKVESKFKVGNWVVHDMSERIRKGLIKGLSAMRDIHKHQTFSDDAININDAIVWLEKQGDKLQKTSIWKHWKNGIAGNGEGEPIYLVKSGNTYSLNSCLGYECDYIELSELDKLMLEKQGEKKPYDKEECLDCLVKKTENFLEMLGYGFTITDNITHTNYDKEQLVEDFKNYMKGE